MAYLHGRDRESTEVPSCEGCQAGVAGVEELDVWGQDGHGSPIGPWPQDGRLAEGPGIEGMCIVLRDNYGSHPISPGDQ